MTEFSLISLRVTVPHVTHHPEEDNITQSKEEECVSRKSPIGPKRSENHMFCTQQLCYRYTVNLKIES